MACPSSHSIGYDNIQFQPGSTACQGLVKQSNSLKDPTQDLSLAACFPASAHPGEGEKEKENEASREELSEVGGRKGKIEGEGEVGLAG